MFFRPMEWLTRAYLLACSARPMLTEFTSNTQHLELASNPRFRGAITPEMTLVQSDMLLPNAADGSEEKTRRKLGGQNTTTTAADHTEAIYGLIGGLVASGVAIIALATPLIIQKCNEKKAQESEHLFAAYLAEALNLEIHSKHKSWHSFKALADLIADAFLSEYPALTDNSQVRIKLGDDDNKSTPLIPGIHIRFASDVANIMATYMKSHPDDFYLERSHHCRSQCGTWIITSFSPSISAIEALIAATENSPSLLTEEQQALARQYKLLSDKATNHITITRPHIARHTPPEQALETKTTEAETTDDETEDTNSLSSHALADEADFPHTPRATEQSSRYPDYRYTKRIKDKDLYLEDRTKMRQLTTEYDYDGQKVILATSSQAGMHKNTIVIEFFWRMKDLGQTCYWITTSDEAELHASLLKIWKKANPKNHTATRVERITQAKQMLQEADLVIYWFVQDQAILQNAGLLFENRIAQKQTILCCTESAEKWHLNELGLSFEEVPFKPYEISSTKGIIIPALEEQLRLREDRRIALADDTGDVEIEARGKQAWSSLWKRLAMATEGIPLHIELLISILNKSDKNEEQLLGELEYYKTSLIPQFDFKHPTLGAFILAVIQHLDEEHPITAAIMRAYSLFLNLNGPNRYVTWLLQQMQADTNIQKKILGELTLEQEAKLDFTEEDLQLRLKEHQILLNTIYTTNPVIRHIFLEILHQQLFQGKPQTTAIISEKHQGYQYIFYAAKYMLQKCKAVYYNYHDIEAKTTLIHCKSVMLIAQANEEAFNNNSMFSEDEWQIYIEFHFYFVILHILDDQHIVALSLLNRCEGYTGKTPQMTFLMKNARAYIYMNLGMIEESLYMFSELLAECSTAFKQDTMLSLVWQTRIADNLAQAYLYAGTGKLSLTEVLKAHLIAANIKADEDSQHHLQLARHFNDISHRYGTVVERHSDEQTKHYPLDETHGKGKSMYFRFHTSVLQKQFLVELFKSGYPVLKQLGAANESQIHVYELRHIIADAEILLGNRDEGIDIFRKILMTKQHFRTFATLGMCLMVIDPDTYQEEALSYFTCVTNLPAVYGPLLCYAQSTAKLASQEIKDCLDNGYHTVLLEPYLISQLYLIDQIQILADLKQTVATLVHRYNKLDKLSSDIVDPAFALLTVKLIHTQQRFSTNKDWFLKIIHSLAKCINNSTFISYLTQKYTLTLSGGGAARTTATRATTVVTATTTPHSTSYKQMRIQRTRSGITKQQSRQELETQLLISSLHEMLEEDPTYISPSICYDTASIWHTPWDELTCWSTYHTWIDYINSPVENPDSSSKQADTARFIFILFIHNNHANQTDLINMCFDCIHASDLKAKLVEKGIANTHEDENWPEDMAARKIALHQYISNKQQWQHASIPGAGDARLTFSASPPRKSSGSGDDSSSNGNGHSKSRARMAPSSGGGGGGSKDDEPSAQRRLDKELRAVV